MANTIGRIPLWLISTVASITIIDLLGVFFMAHTLDWDHPYSGRRA